MSHHSIDPAEMPLRERFALFLSGVAPRPIAFAGTVDEAGRPNLSPFSFFNAFGSNPPTIALSPAYRGKDGTSKHTLDNVRATGQLTVSIVSHAMVEAMNLASAEFEAGVDEWIKAGFSKLPSEVVAPPGVAQSPFVMECELDQVIELGGTRGSGNLVIARVVCFHVREDVLDAQGRVDPRVLDPVARMGGNWYTRALPGLFELPKPTGIPVGVDALPREVRESRWLTGRQLALLGGVYSIPDTSHLQEAVSVEVSGWSVRQVHEATGEAVDGGDLSRAWALAKTQR